MVAAHAGAAYRIRQGNYVAIAGIPLIAVSLRGAFRVLYDDGTEDVLVCSDILTVIGTAFLNPSDHPAQQDGWVVAGSVAGVGTAAAGAPSASVYCQLGIVEAKAAANLFSVIGSGYLTNFRNPNVGTFEPYNEYTAAFVNVTYLQSGAGGVNINIALGIGGVLGAGAEFEIMSGRVVYTGTNSLQIGPATGINGTFEGVWTNVSSVATVTANFPEYNVVSNSATETSATVGWPLRPIISGSSEALLIQAAGAGSGTDTIQLLMTVRTRGALPAITIGGAGTWAVSAGSATFVVK